MLPPVTTTTVRRPRMALASSSSAAMAGAAEASQTNSQRPVGVDDGAADGELAAKRDLREVVARHREGPLADRALEPLGQRRSAVVAGVGAPLVERAAHGAVRFGRGAQDLDPARDDLDADAAGQPAAAHRHDDRLHVGELRQDLARQEAAVAGDHVVVVERRHEDQARIGLRTPARFRLGLVISRAADLDLGAERRDPDALELGRLRRHQHGRLDAEGSRRQRHAEAVVPGRRGDDLAPHARLERQRRQPRRRSAQLERAGALQVLQLQPDVRAGPPPQRGGRHERRDARQPPDPVRDLAPRDLPPNLWIEHPLHAVPLNLSRRVVGHLGGRRPTVDGWRLTR